MTWLAPYQVWLTEEQSLTNAQLVVNHFVDTDWTRESLAAMIGSMRHESSINPNMYEYGYDWADDRGYGLVQWTPRSKYWDWAVANNLAPEDGDSQLARIDYEVDNNIQWIANGHALRYGLSDKYDFSFADFRTNAHGLTVEALTEAFMWNYEGPAYEAGTTSLPGRQQFAGIAISALDWDGTGGGGGPTPPPSGHRPEVVDTTKTVYQYEAEVDGMTYYKVKKGDTLSQIAGKANVKMTDIKRVSYHPIGNVNQLSVDEVLLLPKSVKKTRKTHTVKPGESLWLIASNNNMTVTELQKLNPQIKNFDLIHPGYRIYLEG